MIEILEPAMIAAMTPEQLQAYDAYLTAWLSRPELRAELPLLQWGQLLLSQHFSVPPCRFHRELCADLDSLTHQRGSRINRQAPRGSGKTGWISFAYPLREALEGREKLTVLTTETDTLAFRYLRRIRREIETNRLLFRTYPESCGVGRIWRENQIELPNGCTIAAMGRGGNIRGFIEGSNRPTCIICDDPQDKDSIHSQLTRERDMEWLLKDVMSAGQPTTNFIVAGTTLHRGCIVCELAARPGWQTKVYRAIEHWPTRMDLWTEWQSILFQHEDPEKDRKALDYFERHRWLMEEGEGPGGKATVLWPERWPLYALMQKLCSDGLAAFNSEHQNNPTDPALCEWLEEYFTHPAIWFDEWPANLTVKTIALDPSKGAHDKPSDYAAFVMFGRDQHGVEYVDADLRRVNVDQLSSILVEHVKRFRPDAVAVETNNFQQLLVAPFKAALKASFIEPTIVELTNTTNKMVRIRRLTTPLAERRIRFKRTSPGARMLVQQLQDFPVGGHDDGPDALEQARRTAIDIFNGRTNSGPRPVRFVS